MATKSLALTKEQKKLQSQGASKGRKRAEEKAENARYIVGGTSMAAAAIAGAIDKKSIEKKGKPGSFKFLGMNVPTNLAIGLGGVGGGLLMGRGEIAAGIFGAGMGMGNAAVYRMVVDRKTDDDDEE